SVPFLSAGTIALLERSAINDPAFWRLARRSVSRIARKLPARGMPVGVGRQVPGLARPPAAMGQEVA
ncbi:hypothetical protein ABTN54_19795, partial [Acinetobacter baumannii]